MLMQITLPFRCLSPTVVCKCLMADSGLTIHRILASLHTCQALVIRSQQRVPSTVAQIVLPDTSTRAGSMTPSGLDSYLTSKEKTTSIELGGLRQRFGMTFLL